MTSHEDLERTIVALLASRAADSSICPSEVVRELDAQGWRELMEPVRQAAASLAAEGAIEVTQGGTVVDVASARGPVRLRRGSTWTGPAAPQDANTLR